MHDGRFAGAVRPFCMIALLSTALAGTAAAQAPALSPLESHLVELTTEPAEVALVLDNGTFLPGALVLIAGGLLDNGSAKITLVEAERSEDWTWSAEGGVLHVERTRLAGAADALLIRVEGPPGTRAHFYYDVACNCSPKLAPFPGAVLAFEAPVADGDEATAWLNGTESTAFSVELLDPPTRVQSGPGGNATLQWRATGPTVLLVTLPESVGPIGFALERTPEPTKDIIPFWGPAAIGALVLVAARRSRR